MDPSQKGKQKNAAHKLKAKDMKGKQLSAAHREAMQVQKVQEK